MSATRSDTSGVHPLSSAVLKRLAAVLLPLLALLALAVGAVNARERAEDLELGKRAAFEVVGLQAHTIKRVIEMVSSILLYLGEEPSTARVLSGQAGVAELEADYASLCRNARMFDRVRLIDLAGRELVHVESRGGEPAALAPDPAAAPAEELARRARALTPGQVYISAFDLARDLDGAVAVPWKPVIRFAAPALDATGSPAGLVVLDYFGVSMLRFVYQTGLQVPGWTALIDLDGHFLGAPEGEPPWTGVLGEAPGFAEHHPRAWSALRGQRVAEHLDERGLYVYGLIPRPQHRGPALSDLEVAAVCHVPLEELYAPSRQTLRLLLAGGSAVALVLGAVAWRLAHAATVRVEHERRLAASERGLRKLSARLVEAQEQERRRISRDLHDELGQQATAIAILQKRALRSEDPALRRDLIVQAIAATDALLGGVHRIATSLRTTLLDDLGLGAALRAACAEVGERSGLVVRSELDFDDRELSPELAQAVYRLVQEGLTNALKHARAAELAVSVRQEGQRLAVEVRDDGVGFDPRLPHEDRLGLLGMRERVELLGGAFRCESSPGAGTRLSASFPIDGPVESVP